MKLNKREKIVVTGLGCVCPLGVGVEKVWDRLVEGQSGLVRLDDEIVADLPAKIGAPVPSAAQYSEFGYDETRFVSKKNLRKMDRFSAFALHAAAEAIDQSNWRPDSSESADRTATIIASGIGGFHALKKAILTVEKGAANRLSPFTVPAFLGNLAAGWISIEHGFRGPIGAPATACAASVQAIGEGMRLIRNGEADVAVCGGAEACIDRVSLSSFAAAKALSTRFADNPTEASRPFDVDRDGFVMGEGAGVLVLESESHAKARGAAILCELSGYGSSADAHGLTAGSPDGDGPRRAMEAALKSAELSRGSIGYINAHSTSTQVGDHAELAGISQVFAGHYPAISSTKSATGHLLGAAGALEAIFSIQALNSSILPPTLNLEKVEEEFAELNLIRQEARVGEVNHVMSNGFGFGGVNASVIFSHYDRSK